MKLRFQTTSDTYCLMSMPDLRTESDGFAVNSNQKTTRGRESSPQLVRTIRDCRHFKLLDSRLRGNDGG
ncbi:hypothetical protein [Neisseria sicca]|uniref:hypothetical protein n=1 Tax=Neisseria sicca TaxID=490 RepID=UPI0011BD0A8E|nr:hypothetical protein [Neisseria sicca]